MYVGDLESIRDFSALRIAVASPEDVSSWSFGEVIKPETINYRTFKAEKDGLFDERIFGPTKDYECYCGKYKKARYKGIICDKCGVEVTSKRVRRERMGHINLAAPVAHIWFFRNVPSKMSILLGVSPRNLEAVIYFSKYLVIGVDRDKRKEVLKQFRQDFLAEREQKEKEFNQKLKGLDPQKAASARAEFTRELKEQEETYIEQKRILKALKRLSLLSEEEYFYLAAYVRGFAQVAIGAEAVRKALSNIDLEKVAKSLRKKVADSKGERRVRYTKRLRAVEDFRRAKIDPSWMVLSVLPVIPPDLRPMVSLEGGRFATSDLNDLYRAVINRNNRLRRLLELGAPEIIVRNEKRMLQEAVDALIDASKSRRGRVMRGRRELRSFADMLSGKQGRFRQNLLGKRVDYSGRSVIVVGPRLKLWEAGLPKEMALELFKPMVLREILFAGLAPNLKSAKTYLESRRSEVWDILEKVVEGHPIFLNRAPSLHRLSILAFYPKLISGNAIQIHPAVCNGFNADFDGDQMAIHVPLSKQAIEEAKNVILSSKNLLRPATGDPVAYPNKEQVLGTYYLTSFEARPSQKKGQKEDKQDLKFFSDEEQALLAWELGKTRLREKIRVRISGRILETTVGRIIFNQALPASLRFCNQSVGQGLVRDFIARTLSEIGEEEAALLVDSLKTLGFKYAEVSGVSLSVSDARFPEEKDKILENAEEQAAQIDRAFRRGLITDREKRESLRRVWSAVTGELDELSWDALDQENPIKLMVESNATRATREQVKQISGMRGFVTDPLGRIVEMPIRSNYREGLTGLEYFAGARGARKGLVDTALRTADAGYLTRRLVDVAQDILIREEDCGTREGVTIESEDPALLASFEKRISGRIAASDIKVGRKILIRRNELITPDWAKKICASEAGSVYVRSPLSCESDYGVCRMCYGLDLGRNKMVEIGTPVGVIAAQSIGEPGTQLTLKTKHAGGIVGKDITQGLPRAEEIFEARTPKAEAVMSEIAGKVKIIAQAEPARIMVSGKRDSKGQTAEYEVGVTQEIIVNDGDVVEAGQPLTDGYLDPKKLLKVVGLEQTQRYIVNEVQKVYSSHGIALDDKHIEVIVRQMFSKLRIKNPGDTRFISEEIVSKTRLIEENSLLENGEKKAKGETLLLGITKSSLRTDSFLAAASFIETTRVLTDAACRGEIDRLMGLKENVIIGRLIPTGERARVDKEKLEKLLKYNEER